MLFHILRAYVKKNNFLAILCYHSCCVNAICSSKCLRWNWQICQWWSACLRVTISTLCVVQFLALCSLLDKEITVSGLLIIIIISAFVWCNSYSCQTFQVACFQYLHPLPEKSYFTWWDMRSIKTGNCKETKGISLFRRYNVITRHCKQALTYMLAICSSYPVKWEWDC